MTQLALDFAAEPGLTCAFGTPWPCWGEHDCPGCAAEGERLDAEFEATVAAGEFNQRGYTRAEWTKAGHPAETWQQAKGWRDGGQGVESGRAARG